MNRELLEIGHRIPHLVGQIWPGTTSWDVNVYGDVDGEHTRLGRRSEIDIIPGHAKLTVECLTTGITFTFDFQGDTTTESFTPDDLRQSGDDSTTALEQWVQDRIKDMTIEPIEVRWLELHQELVTFQDQVADISAYGRVFRRYVALTVMEPASPSFQIRPSGLIWKHDAPPQHGQQVYIVDDTTRTIHAGALRIDDVSPTRDVFSVQGYGRPQLGPQAQWLVPEKLEGWLPPPQVGWIMPRTPDLDRVVSAFERMRDSRDIARIENGAITNAMGDLLKPLVDLVEKAEEA